MPVPANKKFLNMFALFHSINEEAFSLSLFSKQRVNLPVVKTFIDWITYYGENNIEKEAVDPNKQNGYSSDTKKVWILWTVFVLLRTSSGSGGAISYSSSSDSKLLVEYSFFNGCNCTLYGGAIFFAYEGQCVLSFVCGVKCNTGKDCFGQFGYMFASSGDYKNYIFDSSVALSKDPSSSQVATLDHERGIFCAKE